MDNISELILIYYKQDILLIPSNIFISRCVSITDLRLCYRL